jgi:hypothetical protein
MSGCPKDQSVKEIYLPVMVIYCGNQMVKMAANEFRADFCSAPKGRLLFSRASNPHFRATHLLDRRGHFHRLTPRFKRRAFLSWFAPVWDFTKLECAIETVDPMKVGELLTESKNWKNDSGQKMRRFLGKQNPEAIFDEAMFRQAWEATYIALPESEWSKVFELRQ